MARLFSTDRILTAIFAALAITIPSLFIYFWDVYFIADHAVSALMAKYILQHGEHPIFLWKVGYMGTIEEYLIAVAYKIFGVGPRPAHLIPSLITMLTFSLYFLYIKKIRNLRFAALSGIFLVISCPFFYAYLTRSQSGYAINFLFGIALFLLYDRLIRGVTIGQFSGVSVLVGAMGFIWGFSLYTYRQIIFFQTAIAIHFFILCIFERNIFGKNPRRYIKHAVIFLTFFILGFSPEIYYRLTDHPQMPVAIGHFSFDGGWNNLVLAGKILLLFLNLQWNDFHALLFAFYASALCWFALHLFKELRLYFKKPRSKSFLDICPPLVILPVIVVPLFVFSKLTYFNTARYMLPIFFFLSLVWAFVVENILQTKWRWRKGCAAAILILLLGNNAYFLNARLQTSNNGSFWRNYIDILDALHIDRAYSVYWLGYPVTFLTDERIIVEPAYDNYSPHYETALKNATRIAYVSQGTSLRDITHDKHLEIRGVRYELERSVWLPGEGGTFHQDLNFTRLIENTGYSIHVLNRRSP